MCCSMLFDLLTILGSILGIFGFILLYINTRPYDWQNIQEWSKRYFLYHPDYYEIKLPIHETLKDDPNFKKWLTINQYKTSHKYKKMILLAREAIKKFQ